MISDENYHEVFPKWIEDKEVNSWGREKIEQMFPGGNFLFHGTSIHAASTIIRTGSLMSSNT
jgi:hypothetical protein